jgi:cyanophycin synthetase
MPIKLISTKIYGGPNLYMLGRAIRLRLDLGEAATGTVGSLGIGEALDAAMPTLRERLGDERAALTLPTLIAEIALDLQLSSECPVRPVALGRFHSGAAEAVYAYRVEEIGIEAGRIAREIVRVLIGSDDADPALDIEVEREDFARYVRRRMPGPSTRALIAEAEARNIPWIAHDDSLIQLGYGKHQRRLSSTFTALTPHIAVNIATDRSLWARLLGDLGLPVPVVREIYSAEGAVAAAERMGYPVSLERWDDSAAVRHELHDAASVKAAFAELGAEDDDMLIERMVIGDDHDLLVIDGNLIAATQHLPDDESADILSRVHPDNRTMAERAIRAIGLDAAIIRYRTPTIAESWRDVDGVIFGIEPEPSLRAAPEAAAAKILDMLFPPGTPSRIPIATLTGTNGKTTTARMLAHILKFAGHVVGLTSTDAVYINGSLSVQGDMTGPAAAHMVLKDPLVDAAVLETARGGLVRAGLGYEQCDVGAVLNVTEDHIGLGGIESIDELALVKRIVVEVARDTAVLNADDPLCLLMADHTSARHICYVTRDPGHALVREHIREGGRAAVLERGLNGDQIVLYDKGAQLPLIWTHLIPATFEGKALHNVENAMFAAAMAFSLGKSLDDIRTGLRTFDMTFFQAPGRLNVFDEHGFRVILDYGHNPAAIKAMVETVYRMAPKGRRIVVIMIPGDRRPADIEANTRLLAGCFDHFIAKQNDDRRGRADGELPELIRESLMRHGIASDQISVIPDEEAAIDAALRMAEPDDLVLIFGEKTTRCWNQIVSFGRGDV